MTRRRYWQGVLAVAVALCAQEGYAATGTKVGHGARPAERGAVLWGGPVGRAQTLALAPDVIFVVVGDAGSGSSGGATRSFSIPVGGSGAQVSWSDQTISDASGHVTSSGSVSNGVLGARFTGQLEFAPTQGSDFFSTSVTVQAYVRGAEQCFKTQCASSGTISVAHPEGCDPAAGPFATASWNGQSVGALNACTGDATVPILSEACADTGISCCATVQFPESPGVEYSLAFSKTYEGRVSQATVGQLAEGVAVTAMFDAEVTISVLPCCPATVEPPSRTAWEMHQGEGLVYFPFSTPYHGWEGEYDYAHVPPADTVGWVAAPNPETIAYSITSTLCGVVGCRGGGQFTYFQTFVTIPQGSSVSTFTIAFSGVDDGVRVTIFNSAYPAGIVVPGSYVFLGGSGTANLANLVVAGEVNRVVVTHVDDCCVGSYLNAANVVLNGAVIPQECPRFIAPTPPRAALIDAPVGGTVIVDVAASDPNATDTITLSALNLPSGATFESVPGNPVSGRLTWAPVTGDVGQRRVEFVARSGSDDPCGDRCTVTTDVVFDVHVGPRPDLTVASVATGSVEVDCQSLRASGSVSALVRNTGAGAAGAFTLQFFEDRNGNGIFESGTDIVIARQSSPGMGAGEEAVIGASVDIRMRFPGSLVYAFADFGNVVDEGDETNNSAVSGASCRATGMQAAFGDTGSVRPAGASRNLPPRLLAASGVGDLPTLAVDAPDLTASSVRFEFYGCPDSFAVAARVGNGGASGVADGVSVAFYDGDPTAGGTLLGILLTKRSLAPGEFEDVTGLFPALSPGDHVFWVVVDPALPGVGPVTECDESNNSCSVAGAVPSKPSCALAPPAEPPQCESSGNRLCLSDAAGSIVGYEWKLVSNASGWEIEDGQGTPCLTYRAGSEGETVVRAILTTSAGCVDSCEILIRCQSGGFVTLTQGGWGNGNGKLNGERRSETLARIITADRPLVLGVPKLGAPASFGSITFTDGNESCVLQRMPGGGKARAFVTNLGDVSPTAGNGCSVAPQTIKNGKFDNVLIGQALALSLNARLDEGLPGIALAETLWTSPSTPGPDGKIGTSDDVCGSGDMRMIRLSRSVLQALDTQGLPQTVGGLIQLANRALSGLSIAPASAEDVSSACAAINEGFDEGRCLTEPPAPASLLSTLGVQAAPIPTAFALLQNVPNPFGGGTNLRFALPERSRVEITIYNMLGQLVARPVTGEMPPGTHSVGWNAVDRAGRPLPSGVYFMRMKAAGLGNRQSFNATRRMVLFR